MSSKDNRLYNRLDKFEVELVNHLRDIENRANRLYDTTVKARKRAEKTRNRELKKRLVGYQQRLALVASAAQDARLAIRPSTGSDNN